MFAGCGANGCIGSKYFRNKENILKTQKNSVDFP
jgi:hypothetical protein